MSLFQAEAWCSFAQSKTCRRLSGNSGSYRNSRTDRNTGSYPITSGVYAPAHGLVSHLHHSSAQAWMEFPRGPLVLPASGLHVSGTPQSRAAGVAGAMAALALCFKAYAVSIGGVGLSSGVALTGQLLRGVPSLYRERDGLLREKPQPGCDAGRPSSLDSCGRGFGPSPSRPAWLAASGSAGVEQGGSIPPRPVAPGHIAKRERARGEELNPVLGPHHALYGVPFHLHRVSFPRTQGTHTPDERSFRNRDRTRPDA